MENTYWTKFKDGHYRVHNNILKYAPHKEKSTTIDLEKEIKVKSIILSKLQEVNKVLKTNFQIDQFN